MTMFKDREHAFEAKFAHDAEMQFRAEARRDKLVGLWAAQLLGKEGQEAEEYAAAVVRADIEEPGIEDVMRKLLKDLDGKASESEIRLQMAQMLPVAKDQLLGEF